MIKSKNKIYIGSRKRWYLNDEIISVIYEYLANQDEYLLEIELNYYTKELLHNLKSVKHIKFYNRTHSWEDIYKVTAKTVKAPN